MKYSKGIEVTKCNEQLSNRVRRSGDSRNVSVSADL